MPPQKRTRSECSSHIFPLDPLLPGRGRGRGRGGVPLPGELGEPEPLSLGPRAITLLLNEPLHAVHGPDRVEPSMPAALGQIFAHPRRLQLLQGVQVTP